MSPITSISMRTPMGPIAPAAHAAGFAPPAPTEPIVVATPAPKPAIVQNVAGPGKLPKELLTHSVQEARKADPNATFAVDSSSNAATFVSGKFKLDVPPGADKGHPDAVGAAFMSKYGLMFGVSDPSKQLKLLMVQKDSLGMTHFRYQQMHEGLPVFGQQVVVHSKGDTVESVGGRVTPNIDAGSTAKLDPNAALQSIEASFGPAAAKSVLKLAEKTLGIWTTGDGRPHLAYEMDVKGAAADQGWRYYVDANDGKVLDHWSNVESILHEDTYDAQNGQSRPGKLVRHDDQAPTSDIDVNAAHDGSKAVYDYYNKLFGRDSIDGKGMRLVSTVHFGNKYNNAYWDGSQMTYGDGDGNTFKPFARGVDVVGHEMTHGVTERTAGLQYFKQSGALNESWSDTMGNLIQRAKYRNENPGKPDIDPDWLVGEDIAGPGLGGPALRSQKAPGTAYPKDPQPADMAHYKDTGSYDNGGVHINSGIPNHAAWLIDQKLGDDKVSKIWYRAQTTYLTANSQFKDAANFTYQAAVDLFGKDSAESAAVKDGWAGVGLDITPKPVA